MAETLEELHAQSVGVGQGAAFQERPDGALDGALGAFAARSGGVADKAVIGLDANEHGVAFEDGALAAVKGKPDGLGERVGEEKRVDFRNLHLIDQDTVTCDVAMALGHGCCFQRLGRWNLPRQRESSCNEEHARCTKSSGRDAAWQYAWVRS